MTLGAGTSSSPPCLSPPPRIPPSKVRVNQGGGNVDHSRRYKTLKIIGFSYDFQQLPSHLLYKSAAATVPATATAAVTSPAELEIAPEPLDAQMFLVLTLPGQVLDVSVHGTH